MAVGAWQFTTTTRKKLHDGTFHLSSDTWKCALFQSTSNIATSSTTYAALTNQVANGNGYVTGGAAVAFTFTGTTILSVAFTSNPAFVAVGGNITGIRNAVVYEVGGDVLAFSVLDSTNITVNNGSILQINSDGSVNPMFTLA